MFINKKEEYEYILTFIKEAEESVSEPLIFNQVRALWTAFCLHHNVCVDTHDYDWRVMELAKAMGVEYKNLNQFDNELAQYLV